MFLSSPISFLLSSLGNKGVTLQMKIYKLFEEHELCRHLHELGNNEKNNEVLSFLNKIGCSPLYIDHYENFDWNARNHWELVKVKIYRSIKKNLAFSYSFQRVTEYSKWTINGDLLLGIALQNKPYKKQLKQIHQLSVKDMVINGHFFSFHVLFAWIQNFNTALSQANHSKEVCLSPQHRKCVELNCTPAGFQLIHKKYPGHLFLLKWRRSISRFEATKWIRAWWESWILWKQVFNVSMTDGNKVPLYIVYIYIKKLFPGDCWGRGE